MPKMTAFKKHTYRGRAYNHRPVLIPGSNPQEFAAEHFYYRDIVLDIAQGTFGRLTVSLPDDATDIMQNARIHNLMDKDGNEIYPGGVWNLSEIMPVFHLGKREGLRGTLTLIGSNSVVVVTGTA